MTYKGVNEVIVVSGLPRSGTSMMMSMLQAGGVELIVDGIREADDDNPKGYFEFEKVKQLKNDHSWLENARGRAVKVISELLGELPPTHKYRVIFMRRKIDEILRSQEQMLVRRGEGESPVDREEMKRIFLKNLDETMDWLRSSDHLDVLFVSYNRLLEEPGDQLLRIYNFLGQEPNLDEMRAMIDKSLYRNRS